MNKFKIERDMGREIGNDVLVIDSAGMHFTHPSFIRHERIFITDKRTSSTIAFALGNCKVVEVE